nr:hypothetical protein HJG59_011500 [Molossus molossus]
MQSSFPHLGKSQGSAFQSAMDTPSPGKTTFLIMPTSQIPALWQPSVCSLDLVMKTHATLEGEILISGKTAVKSNNAPRFWFQWASPLGLQGNRRCPSKTARCQPWWTRPAWQRPNGPAHPRCTFPLERWCIFTVRC